MEILRKSIYHVTAALFLAILVLVGYAVFSRYILNDSSVWVEEVIRFSFIWMFFLGMGEVTRTGTHLALDIVPGLLKGRARKALDVFVEIANIAFLAILVHYSWLVANANMAQKSPALLIPYGYVYMAIPVGSVIMILFGLQRIAGIVRAPAASGAKEGN